MYIARHDRLPSQALQKVTPLLSRLCYMPLLQATIEQAREHLLRHQPVGFLQGDGWFSQFFASSKSGTQGAISFAPFLSQTGTCIYEYVLQ